MKPIVLVSILVVLWLSLGPAHAQSDALMQAYRQYKTLNEQGRYDEAEPFTRRALELGEEELGPEHRTTAKPHPAFWAPFVVVGEGGTFTSS